MNFTEKDIKQIEAKGIAVDDVNDQIEIFKKGLQDANLYEAATVTNGILKCSDAERDEYINYFEENRNNLDIIKFVPASGAATRMFKFLFEFINEFNPEKESFNAYVNRKADDDIELFFVGIKQFPFYDEVLAKTKIFFPEFSESPIELRRYWFVKTMLDSDKFNYGASPKGLLPFHQYKDHVATAFEEHLFEAALYAASNGKAKLHFTISEHHNHKFDDEFKRIENIVESKTNTAFDIDFSYQKSTTDTIAVTPDNQPFRDSRGDLMFRPSGHGALLENLNALEADIIFIKNIDNVVVFQYEEQVAQYKKLLAGILLQLQAKAYHYLTVLNSNNIGDDTLIEIAEFLQQRLNVYISEEFEKYSPKYQLEYLYEKLNKPIRVCGMVKNEGEPGGGPFWVKHENGTISLQIVESSQINKKSKHQKEIFKNATHFNPVDLVCGVKDFRGQKFDLTKFVDHNTAFISKKTSDGQPLKALELPGLWNGGMAFWNTIFVEVPLITFNPAKTINDLLKSPHQIE